jgi:16S rRNA (uracil1498-N3)-methyltransferase
MQLPVFYKDQLSEEGVIVLGEDTSKHVVQVLRMKIGERIQLTDGKGKSIVAEITRDNKKATEVKVISKEFTKQPVKRNTIAISPIKNTSRFEWFLEKATEIGISEIIPMICERTEREHFRYDRMNNILISAMLQSRQTWLPVLHQPTKFTEVIQQRKEKQKFVAHCLDGEKQTLSDRKSTKGEHALILIGPEGDFTEKEVAMAIDNQYVPISLGNTRLRTETAGLVSCVLLAQ